MSNSDDASIRDLLGRTALLADEGAADGYRQVYTDDATWTSGGTTQAGVEQIIAASAERRTAGVVGPGSSTRHVVAPLTVTVEADTATSVSYFLFLTETTGTPAIRKFAVYEDTWRRTAAGWRISSRVVR